MNINTHHTPPPHTLTSKPSTAHPNVTVAKIQPSRARYSSASSKRPCSVFHTDALLLSSHAIRCLFKCLGNCGLTPWDTTNTATPGGSPSNIKPTRRSCPATCQSASMSSRNVWELLRPPAAAEQTSCIVGVLGPSSSAQTCLDVLG